MEGFVTSAPIRPLSTADLDGCLSLALDQNWSRESTKWKLLLETSEGFGIDDLQGELASAVILSRTAEVAVVGMLLVRRRYARQGLGTRLMLHAHAMAADAAIYLYATDEGGPLYEKLGYGAVDRLVTHIGEFSVSSRLAPAATRAFAAPDLERVLRLDRLAFGADRRSVLEAMLKVREDAQVAMDREHITGYALAWRNVDVLHIGPVVAPDDHVACSLIEKIGRRHRGFVRVDFGSRFAEASRWASRCGLLPTSASPLMVLKGAPLPGDRTKLYAVAMQATG